jgi:hypothetical protein
MIKDRDALLTFYDFPAAASGPRRVTVGRGSGHYDVTHAVSQRGQARIPAPLVGSGRFQNLYSRRVLRHCAIVSARDIRLFTKPTIGTCRQPFCTETGTSYVLRRASLWQWLGRYRILKSLFSDLGLLLAGRVSAPRLFPFQSQQTRVPRSLLISCSGPTKGVSASLIYVASFSLYGSLAKSWQQTPLVRCDADQIKSSLIASRRADCETVLRRRSRRR